MVEPPTKKKLCATLPMQIAASLGFCLRKRGFPYGIRKKMNLDTVGTLHTRPLGVSVSPCLDSTHVPYTSFFQPAPNAVPVAPLSAVPAKRRTEGPPHTHNHTHTHTHTHSAFAFCTGTLARLIAYIYNCGCCQMWHAAPCAIPQILTSQDTKQVSSSRHVCF